MQLGSHFLKGIASLTLSRLPSCCFSNRALGLQKELHALLRLHLLWRMKAGEYLQSQLRFDHVKPLLQVEELHALLRPHLLRRMKADVLQALPPKKEQIVRVELSGPQRTLYKALLTNSYQTLIGGAHRCFIPRVPKVADSFGMLCLQCKQKTFIGGVCCCLCWRLLWQKASQHGLAYACEH